MEVQGSKEASSSPAVMGDNVNNQRHGQERRSVRIRQRRGANRRLHQNMPKNIPFCDFFDVDLQSKNTKGNSKAHTYSEERKKSLVLGAMMGKVALAKACHAGNLSSVQKLVIDFGVSAKQDSMALHSASDAGYHEIVQFLLRQGADVNCRDPKMRTALMYAAYKDNVGTLRALLHQGADLELQDSFGSTALMYAASGGSKESCRILADHGADLDMQNKDGLGSLVYAIQNRRHSTLNLLLDLGANPYVSNCLGTSALHWAAKKGEVECCATLLQHGVDVDTPNNKGVTPLMYAADCVPRYGSNIRVMKFLIDSGANLRALDEDLSSALMYAAHSGSEANIGLLIKCGADPSRENKFGATPIMYAAYYGHLTAFVSFVQQNPLEWEPKLHTLFPMEIQDKVRAILTAAQASDNRILQRMPLYILLNTISQFAKFEMWPVSTH